MVTTQAEFRRRAETIAQARGWRLDVQEHGDQIEAWFSDPRRNDVDTAQAYQNETEGLVGLVELENGATDPDLGLVGG